MTITASGRVAPVCILVLTGTLGIWLLYTSTPISLRASSLEAWNHAADEEQEAQREMTEATEEWVKAEEAATSAYKRKSKKEAEEAMYQASVKAQEAEETAKQAPHAIDDSREAAVEKAGKELSAANRDWLDGEKALYSGRRKRIRRGNREMAFANREGERAREVMVQAGEKDREVEEEQEVVKVDAGIIDQTLKDEVEKEEQMKKETSKVNAVQQGAAANPPEANPDVSREALKEPPVDEGIIEQPLKDEVEKEETSKVNAVQQGAAANPPEANPDVLREALKEPPVDTGIIEQTSKAEAEKDEQMKKETSKVNAVQQGAAANPPEANPDVSREALKEPPVATGIIEQTSKAEAEKDEQMKKEETLKVKAVKQGAAANPAKANPDVSREVDAGITEQTLKDQAEREEKKETFKVKAVKQGAAADPAKANPDVSRKALKEPRVDEGTIEQPLKDEAEKEEQMEKETLKVKAVKQGAAANTAKANPDVSREALKEPRVDTGIIEQTSKDEAKKEEQVNKETDKVKAVKQGAAAHQAKANPDGSREALKEPRVDAGIIEKTSKDEAEKETLKNKAKKQGAIANPAKANPDESSEGSRTTNPATVGAVSMDLFAVLSVLFVALLLTFGSLWFFCRGRKKGAKRKVAAKQLIEPLLSPNSRFHVTSRGVDAPSAVSPAYRVVPATRVEFKDDCHPLFVLTEADEKQIQMDDVTCTLEQMETQLALKKMQSRLTELQGEALESRQLLVIESRTLEATLRMEAQNEAVEVKAQSRELETELAQTKCSIDRLSAEFESLEERSRKETSAYVDAVAREVGLRAQIEFLEDARRRDSAEAKVQSHEAETELAEAKSHICALRSELELSDDHVRDEAAKAIEVNSRHFNAQTRFEFLQEASSIAVAKAEAHVREAEAERAEAKAQLSVLQTELDLLRLTSRQVAEGKSSQSEVWTQLQLLQERYNNASTRYQMQARLHESQLSAAKTRETELCSEIQQNESDANAREADLKVELRRQSFTEIAEVEAARKLETQLTEVKCRVDLLVTELESVGEKARDETVLAANARSREAGLRTQVELLQRAACSASEETEVRSREAEAQILHHMEAKSRLSVLQTELDTLGERACEVAAEAVEAKLQHALVRSEFELSQERFRKASHEDQTQAREDQTQLAAAKSHGCLLQSEVDSFAESARAEAIAASEARSQYAGIRAQFQLLDEASRMESREAEIQLAQSRSCMELLQAELGSLLQHVRGEADAAARTKSEYTFVWTKLESLQEASRSCAAEAQAQLLESKSELSEAQSCVETLQSEVYATIAHAQNETAAAADLTFQHAELQKQVVLLQEECSSNCAAVRLQSREAEGQVVEVRSRLYLLETELDSVGQRTELAATQVAEAKSQYAEARAQFEMLEDRFRAASVEAQWRAKENYALLSAASSREHLLQIEMESLAERARTEALAAADVKSQHAGVRTQFELLDVASRNESLEAKAQLTESRSCVELLQTQMVSLIDHARNEADAAADAKSEYNVVHEEFECLQEASRGYAAETQAQLLEAKSQLFEAQSCVEMLHSEVSAALEYARDEALAAAVVASQRAELQTEVALLQERCRKDCSEAWMQSREAECQLAEAMSRLCLIQTELDSFSQHARHEAAEAADARSREEALHSHRQLLRKELIRSKDGLTYSAKRAFAAAQLPDEVTVANVTCTSRAAAPKAKEKARTQKPRSEHLLVVRKGDGARPGSSTDGIAMKSLKARCQDGLKVSAKSLTSVSTRDDTDGRTWSDASLLTESPSATVLRWKIGMEVAESVGTTDDGNSLLGEEDADLDLNDDQHQSMQEEEDSPGVDFGARDGETDAVKARAHVSPVKRHAPRVRLLSKDQVEEEERLEKEFDMQIEEVRSGMALLEMHADVSGFIAKSEAARAKDAKSREGQLEEAIVKMQQKLADAEERSRVASEMLYEVKASSGCSSKTEECSAPPSPAAERSKMAPNAPARSLVEARKAEIQTKTDLFNTQLELSKARAAIDRLNSSPRIAYTPFAQRNVPTDLTDRRVPSLRFPENYCIASPPDSRLDTPRSAPALVQRESSSSPSPPKHHPVVPRRHSSGSVTTTPRLLFAPPPVTPQPCEVVTIATPITSPRFVIVERVADQRSLSGSSSSKSPVPPVPRLPLLSAGSKETSLQSPSP